MYLQDIPDAGFPYLDHVDKINLTKRLRYQQKLRDEKRAEYLGNLGLKQTSVKSSYELKVGDSVLIKNEDKLRTFWFLRR
ncbi:hypothetical protein TNIN_248741 [Trichonephila inaurata madagascariensis]|uniref:Uncharacterized protein n=1 Tax=Trichonephila inaurata madagascariensis TaxID=2747483 RepID=A0A8X6J9Z2_9ARAC|nr:hypothetical protein TNIN_248741 [Trichonephila inaurata madagascariensis]